MNIGMLWFDNDPKTDPADKIRKAAGFYASKYGPHPNLAFVHPSWNVTETVDGIQVKVSAQTLPNHIWIGVEMR